MSKPKKKEQHHKHKTTIKMTFWRLILSKGAKSFRKYFCPLSATSIYVERVFLHVADAGGMYDARMCSSSNTHNAFPADLPFAVIIYSEVVSEQERA